MAEDIVRMYNVLPAIEQTKLLIIERLKVIFDYMNVMFQNKLMNKKDDEVIAVVKATTISLYIMLKPKIIEHIRQQQRVNPNDPLITELLGMVAKIEDKKTNPSSMTIEDAIDFADVLNVFCHEYGVTRITFFSGTATPSEKDIYKV